MLINENFILFRTQVDFSKCFYGLLMPFQSYYILKNKAPKNNA